MHLWLRSMFQSGLTAGVQDTAEREGLYIVESRKEVDFD